MHNSNSDTDFLIRAFADGDSIAELTSLLHRAYKRLGDMGLRFFATHQSDDDTLNRIRRGRCFVGVCDEVIVATITLYRSRKAENDGDIGSEKSGPAWYQRGDVAYFGQFAVDPEYQGRGLGNLLLAHVESTALDDDTAELALDTAETATHLIDYYARHGYRIVETTQWSVTNYRSVVMSKKILASPSGPQGFTTD